MEKKYNHLNMIQGIINRMASNSFALKGWAVTLVAGIFALSSKDADKTYFLIAYVPIIIFWILDSYYLWQERLFRDLYNDVSKKAEKDIDYKMDISTYKTKKFIPYCKCLFSVTEIGFYLPLAFVSTAIIIITNI